MLCSPYDGGLLEAPRRLAFEDVETLKGGDREKSTLDHKRFSTQFVLKDVAEDFVAFANSAGGRIIFGALEKDDRLTGYEGIAAEDLRKWTSRVRNAAHAVQPPVDVDVRDIETPDGKCILVVEIPPDQLGPFQYQGKYLQRASSGNVAMPHSSVVHAVATARSAGFGLRR